VGFIPQWVNPYVLYFNAQAGARGAGGRIVAGRCIPQSVKGALQFLINRYG